MHDGTAKVVLVTGASSGFGQACAEHLTALGHVVYGTSRRAPAQGEDDPRGRLIRMDVDDADSVRTAIADVLRREGRIDAVVNNAGMGIAGAIEDTSLAEARRQLETNFFGVVRVCAAVLPHMRQRRTGHVVTIGSLGGVIAIPFQGFYSASKFALEGFSASLRMEVMRHGIAVTLIDPGDFSTGFTAHRTVVAAASGSPYEAEFRRALGIMERDEQAGPPPLPVARLVGRVLASRRPRPRYVAARRTQRFADVLRRVLPAAAFERMVMASYGVPRR